MKVVGTLTGAIRSSASLVLIWDGRNHGYADPGHGYTRSLLHGLLTHQRLRALG